MPIFSRSLTAVMLVAFLAGCGGSSSNPILGKWMNGTNGLTVDFEPDSVIVPVNGQGFIVGYKTAGVASSTPDGTELITVPVTYSIDGNVVHMQLKDGTPGNTALKEFRLNADQSMDVVYTNSYNRYTRISSSP